MFKELGSMMSLLKNKGAIAEEMQKFQANLGNLVAEGKAGMDYITVKVNGRMEVIGVRISRECMEIGDHEMMESLFAAATNEAFKNVRVKIQEETAKMTANLGLPAGMLGSLGVNS